jgi:hypothetical protein
MRDSKDLEHSGHEIAVLKINCYISMNHIIMVSREPLLSCYHMYPSIILSHSFGKISTSNSYRRNTICLLSKLTCKNNSLFKFGNLIFLWSVKCAYTTIKVPHSIHCSYGIFDGRKTVILWNKACMDKCLYVFMRDIHRLNMELDIQSLFELHVHSCTHWLNPPPPHLGSYTRALLVKIDNFSLWPHGDIKQPRFMK